MEEIIDIFYMEEIIKYIITVKKVWEYYERERGFSMTI